MIDARLIDEVCDAFESAWKSGCVPEIKEYAGRLADDEERRVGLRELILLDVEYRRKTGRPVEWSDYARFGINIAESVLRENASSTADPEIQATVSWHNESVSTIEPLAAENPRHEESLLGADVGDYVILREVARGGMGIVYQARHRKLDRVVALKMILSGSHADQQDVLRFQTEARATAQLDHPGVVPVFEIGEFRRQQFFTMAYIDGESLADRVRESTLSPADAAEITMKIATAIAHAHDHGVIHRDLKPSNVLLDSNGEPKITDFGLARTVNQDAGLTQTGQIMGTPSYMAPEQAAGRTSEIGPSADVYAIGGILYRLLTGRPPFQASNVLETIRQVAEDEPISPQSVNPEVDDDLETLCLRCLEKDAHARPQSAEFLAEELDRYLNGVPIQSRTPSWIERLKKWCVKNRAESVVIVMALMIIVLVGALLAMNGLPGLREVVGEKTTANALVLFCFAGPTVTATRMLGFFSARPAEMLVMHLGRSCLASGYGAVAGFTSFIILTFIVSCCNLLMRMRLEEASSPQQLVVPVLSATVLASAIQLKFGMKQSCCWMWISGVAAVAAIFYAPVPEVSGGLLSFFFCAQITCALTYGCARLAYPPLHKFAVAVQRSMGWIPWPVSRVAGPFRVRHVVLVWNLFPLVLLVGVVQILFSAALILVAIPVWAFEQLRLVLFPKSQVLTESLGYAVSGISVVILLTNAAVS